jgi:hypothetical protein
MQPYFILSPHDDPRETLYHESMPPSRVQTFFTMAGMVGMINSVLLGCFASILLALLAFPLGACITTGSVVFLASVALHQIYQLRQCQKIALLLGSISILALSS